MADGATEQRICSKCSKEPAVDGQAWGKKCFATYRREAVERDKEMIAAKAWADGVAALKAALASAFAVYPSVPFYGFEIAQKIQQFQPPKRTP